MTSTKKLFTRRNFITNTLYASAALGFAGMLAGCDSNEISPQPASSQKTTTLEDLVAQQTNAKEQLSEIGTMLAQTVTNATGLPCEGQCRVKGNQLQLTTIFKKDANTVLVELGLSALTGETNSLQKFLTDTIIYNATGIADTVQELEDASGIEGITFCIIVCDCDGTILSQAAFDSTGRIPQ